MNSYQHDYPARRFSSFWSRDNEAVNEQLSLVLKEVLKEVGRPVTSDTVFREAKPLNLFSFTADVKDLV